MGKHRAVSTTLALLAATFMAMAAVRAQEQPPERADKVRLLTDYPDLQAAKVRLLTDYPDLQAAIDSLPGRMGAVYVPPGTYVISKTIDLTVPKSYGGGIKIFGAGRASKLVGDTKGQPIFDFTGASHCYMHDLTVESKSANIGFLLARRTDGGAAQEHRFSRLMITGACSIANVYNVTAELVRFTDCIFIQKAPDAHNIIWSSENHLNVESPYRGKLRTLYSNTEFRLARNTIYNWGGGTKGTNIYLRGFTVDLSITDCYLGQASLANILSEDSSKGGPLCTVKLDGIRVESSAKHVILVRGRADGWSVKNCTLHCRNAPLIEATEGSCGWWGIENVWFWNMGGKKTMMRFGDIHHSTIDGTHCEFQNWGEEPDEPGKPVRIAVTKRSHANDFRVQTRDAVVLPEGAADGTVITATEDGGVRRRYAGSSVSGEVLNMEMVDTKTIKDPKRGDIALDDGTNTPDKKPALAIYDGKQWIFR